MNEPEEGSKPWPAICRVLQSLTRFRGTAADWVRWLGARTHDPQETFPLLQRAFLQKEAAPATHIFCPNCYCQHEVFIWTADTMKALCAELYPGPGAALCLPGKSSSSSNYASSVNCHSGCEASANPLNQPSTPNPQPSTNLCTASAELYPTDDSPSEGPLTFHASRFTPTITAICRCDDHPGCPDLQLTQADLEVWSLNWGRLSRELCRALELNPQFLELSLRNTCQIGSWSGDAVPVLLTIQPDRERLQAAVLELSARFRQRFIVVGPTARHLDASCIELLEHANAAYYPLDSNLALTHNPTLQPVRPPGELFARFSPQLNDSDFSEAQRVFALVQQLDSSTHRRLPSVLTVFRFYCIEDLTSDQIAEKCRCAKGTIVNRLHQIRKATGADPILFRRISAHFDRMLDAATDSRARSTHLRAD